MSSKLLSDEFKGYGGQVSMIRKMFELGLKLKEQYGPDSVCDFSIGNPDVPAPPETRQALLALAEEADQPFAFGYMPSAGFPWLLEKMAEVFSREQGVALKPGEIMTTGGAAGALNCIFRAMLCPGDEVLGVKPFFSEYLTYLRTSKATYVPVSLKEDFSLDLAGLQAAVTPKTRIVLINSPHNPTGKVFSKEDLGGLADILRKKSAEFGKPILLLADEPYRALAFDGVIVPSVLGLYEYSAVASSFAKNISLPGERLGFVICSPNMPDKADFMAGVTLASRMLGFVNAPVMGQKVLKFLLGKQADMQAYARRRDAMAAVLTGAGYEFTLPQGAFYFFPRSPLADDVAFVEMLAEHRVLGVPGTAFGMPGYFRLTFCVNDEVIHRSAAGFKSAMQAARGL